MDFNPERTIFHGYHFNRKRFNNSYSAYLNYRNDLILARYLRKPHTQKSKLNLSRSYNFLSCLPKRKFIIGKANFFSISLS